MDDAARRARGIVTGCRHGVAFDDVPVSCASCIATALRELEAERDKWKITSDAHALVIEQDLQPEIARLATRLARVEGALREAIDEYIRLCCAGGEQCRDHQRWSAAMTPDATTECRCDPPYSGEEFCTGHCATTEGTHE